MAENTISSQFFFGGFPCFKNISVQINSYYFNKYNIFCPCLAIVGIDKNNLILLFLYVIYVEMH